MSDDFYDEDNSEMEYGDSQGYSSDGGGYGAFEDIETSNAGWLGQVGFQISNYSRSSSLNTARSIH
jgi:hypothetical protein